MKKQTNLKSRQRGNVEPDSFLYGKLLSNLDNLLLYNYLELKTGLFNFLQTQENQNTNILFIQSLINSLNEKIADNNRILRNLDIEIENEKTEPGFISLNRDKRNKLLSINDKATIFIKDVELFLNSIPKKKATDKKYNSLDELFINPDDIEPSIKALSSVNPPLISDSGQFIGKLKSALVVWINVLRSKGKLHKIEDKFLPELLTKKFPELTISQSLFRQSNFRAEDIYKLDFQALISKKL